MRIFGSGLPAFNLIPDWELRNLCAELFSEWTRRTESFFVLGTGIREIPLVGAIRIFEEILDLPN